MIQGSLTLYGREFQFRETQRVLHLNEGVTYSISYFSSSKQISVQITVPPRTSEAKILSMVIEQIPEELFQESQIENHGRPRISQRAQGIVKAVIKVD